MYREPYFGKFALCQLQPFVEQFSLQYIQGEKGCQLAYRHFTSPTATLNNQPKKLVILVNGRAENLLKWSEIAYDFFLSGYDVLAFDHRGQGYSDRLLADREKGHLDEFRFYAKDLATIVSHITQQHNYQTQYLIAHSLGALISSLYLANYDHHIKRAVLSAPFFGMPLKHPVRDELLVGLMNLLGFGTHYVFGKTHYKPTDLHKNELSFCKTRMKWMNRINRKFPEVHLGGPTFRWVHLCMQAIKRLPKILSRIEIPVLIFESENDGIVSNRTLKKLTTYLPNAQHQVFTQTKHEILFEKDAIREDAIKRILTFFHE